MDGPVSTPVAWREVADPDPSNTIFWRCRALQLEMVCRCWICGDDCDDWAPDPGMDRTPEREALWLDLFLRP